MDTDPDDMSEHLLKQLLLAQPRGRYDGEVKWPPGGNLQSRGPDLSPRRLRCWVRVLMDINPSTLSRQ